MVANLESRVRTGWWEPAAARDKKRMSGTRLTITTGGTAVAGETAWANLLAERHEIVAERERLRTGDAELVHGGLTVVVERKCVEDWAKNHETFVAERARLCAMRSDACVPMVLMHGVRPPCDDSMVCSYGGMTGKRLPRDAARDAAAAVLAAGAPVRHHALLRGRRAGAALGQAAARLLPQGRSLGSGSIRVHTGSIRGPCGV